MHDQQQNKINPRNLCDDDNARLGRVLLGQVSDHASDSGRGVRAGSVGSALTYKE